MKTISISVEPEIQAAFERASEEERRTLSVLIGVFFKERWAGKSLIEVMREIGDRAEKRGLTPEILSEILDEGTRA